MTPTNELGQPVGEAVPGWTPRSLPGPEVLLGRTCRLERLGPQHAGPLYEAVCRSAGDGGPDALFTYLAWDPPRSAADVARIVDGLVADPGWVPMAIVTDDGPVGMASWLRIDPAAGSVEVGGLLYTQALQRTTAATEAMYLMARHALDDLGYRRYEWKCDSLNAPSRAAALRLGFSYEGIFRQALVYKGRNRDTAWFAMTDAQWREQLRPAYEQWLAAENFDEAGRQRQGLRALIG